MKSLAVLGATGSIGRQSIEVAARIGHPVAAIATRRASDELISLAKSTPDALVVVTEPGRVGRQKCADELGARVDFGYDALDAIVAAPNRTVINGVVGAVGLRASLGALEAGNRLALANKESLVAGGPLIADALANGQGELIPVDSEHSAIWQCLVGESATVRRLILTASGGPFRGASRSDLESVTVAEALDHPTWSMGARITIDSSTLMNKALEVIEAHFLFGTSFDQIDVVVHPQSIIHSMVEFEDGSVKAQMGDPDMGLPIQYAITYPDRKPSPDRTFDPVGHTLTFEKPDLGTFRLLGLGYSAGRAGGSTPAVFNAADEVAVAAFLDGRLRYLDIEATVEHTLGATDTWRLRSVDDVVAADSAARRVAHEFIERRPPEGA